MSITHASLIYDSVSSIVNPDKEQSVVIVGGGATGVLEVHYPLHK